MATHDRKPHPGIDARNAPEEPGHRRPFDTSDMNWVPELDDDDPPYRDWWAIGSEEDHE